MRGLLGKNGNDNQNHNEARQCCKLRSYLHKINQETQINWKEMPRLQQTILVKQGGTN